MSEEKIEERKSNMAALRLPTQQVDFVRANPRVGQTIGQIVIFLTELEEQKAAATRILDQPKLFEGLLENGTKEDLDAFLTEVKLQIGKALLLKDLNDDEFDKVINSLKASSVNATITTFDEETKTVSTNKVEDQPKRGNS